MKAEGAQLSINTITKETVIFLIWIEIVWGILLEELMHKGFMTPMIFEVKIARCRKRAKATEKRNPRVRENLIKTPVAWQRSSLNSMEMIQDQPTLPEVVAIEFQHPLESLVIK